MTGNIVKWKFALQSIKNFYSVALLYVLNSKGSSPGRQGFFMVVDEEENMIGSIGGGIMEYKFVEMVKASIKNAETKNSIHHQIHDKSSRQNQSGMICSGEQTIAIIYLKTEHMDVIKSIIESLEKNSTSVLTISYNSFSISKSKLPTQYKFEFKNKTKWIYKEKLGFYHQLTILGGGHCSLALSKIMFDLNFYTRIIDDRKNLNTIIQNTFVQEKIFVNSYSELRTHFPNASNHYIVIMTQGYRSDEMAIKALKNKKFKYIGLLGSKIKTKKLLSELKKDGFQSDFINVIYTPIGLPIKSETPEEIAISIAAEIIKIKNT